MESKNYKTKLIYILVGIAIFLLFVNISVEKIASSKEEDSIAVVKKENLDSTFMNVMEQFGIEKEWVSVKKVNNKKYKALSTVYYVDIPMDIPIASIVALMNEKMIDRNCKLISEEKKNFSDSILKIMDNDELVFEAFLNHKKKISRSFASLAFVVFVPPKPDEFLYQRILSSEYPFYITVIPALNGTKKVKEINSHLKGHAVLLNDEIDESIKINKDVPPDDLKKGIQNLINVYGKSTLYLIDEASGLYQSILYNFVRDAFEEYGVTLVKLSEMTSLYGNNRKDLASRLDFHCESSKGKEIKVIYTSYENFLEIGEALIVRKRKGDKVVSPRMVYKN